MNVIINNFNNVALNYLSRRFNLDNYGYQLLSSTLITTTTYASQINLTDFAPAEIYDHLHGDHIIILIVGGILIYGSYRKISNYLKPKYKSIRIENSHNLMTRLSNYMKNFPEYFQTENASICVQGTGNMASIMLYTNKVYFKDPSFESYGYIKYENKTKKDPSDDKKIFEYIVISIYLISSPKFQKKSYLTHMSEQNNIIRKMSTDIQLNYFKLCNTMYITNIVYIGTVDDLDKENKILYKTYFSQYKYLIDGFVNNTQGCNNIMCYGPPGIGKSRFIYLCSRLLKCNIYSIDLSKYITNKKDLLKLFNGMMISLSANAHIEVFTNTQKGIISLDEFDYAVDQIIEYDNLKKKRANSDNPKILESESKDYLKLSDLLELFQGAVPMPNRYIIANTNNFDKIKNLIPALFRPGRMTPIEFKYITWDCLDEITMHYYDKKISCSRSCINIAVPTSLIIQEIESYSKSKKPFEEFEQHMIHLLIESH